MSKKLTAELLEKWGKSGNGDRPTLAREVLALRRENLSLRTRLSDLTTVDSNAFFGAVGAAACIRPIIEAQAVVKVVSTIESEV